MVIKINYTSSDIYVSTNVSPVYVVVSYGGTDGGSAIWGQITGTLSNQTDLQNALNAKFDDPTGTTSQYLRGDGSLATFPTIPGGTVTSVGLTMPSAFNVANSPVTSAGTLAVTGAGLATQYIRGDGQLATFPSTASGGSSVNYYLNGSINASVAGYKQLDNNAIVGGGTDFTLVGNGLIAQFLTDAGNPNRIQIPGGAWNFEMYFQVSSSGGNQKFYVELLKYNGTTFTSIASSSAVPEEITGGTAIDLYLTSLAVPTTVLLTTDRLAIRVYIVDNAGGRTVTLHTENTTLCEIITTFAGGVASLNGLTANTQYLATGTSGTDFAISSLSDTHTFNLPTASATNRGALSSADWSTFNGKVGGTGVSGQVAYWNGTNSQTGSNNLFWDAANSRLGIGTNAPTRKLHVVGTSALFQNAGTFELDLLNTTSGNYLRATAGATDSNIGTIQNIPFSFIINGSRVGQFTSTNGNLILQNGGTFTDAGYRLDVNGTARVSGAATFSSSVTAIKALIGDNGFGSQWAVFNHADSTGASNAFVGIDNSNGSQISNIKTNGTFEWRVSNSNVMNLKTSGNLLVGTTVDSGERLQVNGSILCSLDLNLTRTGVSPAITLNQPQLRLVDNSTSTTVNINIVSGGLSFGGSVTATSFIKSGGTSSQYLMADGSVTTGGGGGVDELQVALICQVFG